MKNTTERLEKLVAGMERAISPEERARIRPSEFMKMRRPEEFSDSEIVEEEIIPKEMFDYFLERLTERSQEKDFELFC